MFTENFQNAPRRLSKLHQFQADSRQIVNDSNAETSFNKNAQSVLTARKSEGILISSRNPKKSSSTLKHVSFNLDTLPAKSARIIEQPKMRVGHDTILNESKNELSRVIEKNCEMLNSSDCSLSEDGLEEEKLVNARDDSIA